MKTRHRGSSSQAHCQEDHGSNASLQNSSRGNFGVSEQTQAAAPYSMQRLALQSALLLAGLCAAYLYKPQLDRRFLLALGSALQVLLIIRVLVGKSFAAAPEPAPRPAFSAAGSDSPSKPRHPQTPNLSGVWIKDKAASDSMEPTMHLMQVNRLIRSAVRLVRGTELRQTANSFEIAVLSGILWFKIKEEYPLTGEVRRFKRRDLRRGMHRGSAEKLPDGAICVTLEWDDPLGGIGTDVFYIPAPGLLYVDSTLLMQGQIVKYRTVYKKQ